MSGKLSLFNLDRIRQGRLPWIDYARAIAIFLVLYRHVFVGIKRSGVDISHYIYLEHANIIFFSFRMPLFFIISGLFITSSLAKRGLAKFVASKWRLLLYPYLLWAVIQVSLQLLLSRYVNAERDYRDYFYILYAPREIDQFWYLYTLFNTSVLYAFLMLKCGLRPWQQLGLGFVMYLGSCLLAQHRIDLGFVYDILHFYFFIALGDIGSSYVLNKKNVPLFSSWKLLFIITPLFALCQWYFLETNLAHRSYSYVEDFQPLLFLLISMSGCLLMANCSFILQRYKALSFLRVLGYYSLYIYLMHVLASSATRLFLTKVLHVSNVPFLLIAGITVGLVLPVILYNLLVQAGAWWLFSPEKRSASAPAAT
jgi:fucose 4-O-acetylase-like acetyltransferase